MLERDAPGYAFTVTRRPSPGALGGLSWEFEGGREGKRSIFTVWTDEACRAFPGWTAAIGIEPRRKNSTPAPF